MLNKSLLLLLCCLFISASTFAQSWTEKVNPHLLEQVQEKEKVEMLVIMEEQADVSKAYMLKDKKDKGRYVVSTLRETAKRTQQNVVATIKDFNAPLTSYYVANLVWSFGDIKLIEALANIPEVKMVSVNPSPQPMQYNLTGDDPNAQEVNLRSDLEIGVENIQADHVWELGYTGQGAVIAGADTGYKWDHESIKSSYRGWDGTTANHDYNWHDAIDVDPAEDCPGNSVIPCDGHDHGTHTMGTMTGDDASGTAIGVAYGAKWIGCRNMFSAGVGIGGLPGGLPININLNGNDVGALHTYYECIEWFIAPYPVGDDNSLADSDMAPHVINNSWGCAEGCVDEIGPAGIGAMKQAIANLRAAGILFVASAGNDGSNCSTIAVAPSFFDECFTIGALEQNNTEITSFSSRGPVASDGSMRIKPDIAAPGRNVLSATKGSTNEYKSFSGTSMSGPHAAAAVALVISANPALAGHVDDIEELFRQTVIPTPAVDDCINDSGQIPNNTFGYGRLDALAAVNLALETVLPVSLTSFSGKWENNFVGLYWSTGAEENNAYFEIQRSIDLENWETIGKVLAKNTQNYSFDDYTAEKGTNYYRLNQVDNSGKATLSKAIVVRALINAGEVAVIYPNPSNGVIKINLVDESLLEHGNLQVLIFNGLGQLEQRQDLKNQLEFLNLGQGMHYYQIVNNQNQLLQKGKLIVNK